MPNYICVTSHSSVNGDLAAGDVLLSSHAAVVANPSFFELQTDATKRVASVSFAYLTRMIQRGDKVPSADAAVTANGAYFAGSGSAAETAARLERVGAHR